MLNNDNSFPATELVPIEFFPFPVRVETTAFIQCKKLPKIDSKKVTTKRLQYVVTKN